MQSFTVHQLVWLWKLQSKVMICQVQFLKKFLYILVISIEFMCILRKIKVFFLIKVWNNHFMRISYLK